jgi:hypothetical protein
MTTKKAEAEVLSDLMESTPTPALLPMAHLKGKSLTLYDRYAEHKYWPLGAPEQTVVGAGIHARVVVRSSPKIKFKNHLYRTTDPQIAMGMIEHKSCFERPWGFRVNEECLPDELQATFIQYARENRRIIIRALIQGHTAKAAMNMIIPELQAEIAKDDTKGQPKRELMCPVVGCGKVVPEGAKKARAALIAHVRTQHPEFEGSVG